MGDCFDIKLEIFISYAASLQENYLLEELNVSSLSLSLSLALFILFVSLAAAFIPELTFSSSSK
jgi:hypothetical protein